MIAFNSLTPIVTKRKKTSELSILRFIGESKLRLTLQKKNPAVVGKWLRENIADLGPAFIKLGQFLSTRKDLFSREIADELALLQDDITPVPFEDLIPILNEGLGCDYTEVFSEIDAKSIASASIGQVHKGILRNSNKDVAIKIHKPNISEQIRDDIELLKRINSLFAFTKSPRAKEFDSIISEYERFLSAELDFRKESIHMIRFKQLLEGLPVKIPAVSTKNSSEKVLVMEYVKSIKVTDLEMIRKMNLSPENVATNLIKVFLHQIIENGYVHSDPHPGNIGVLSDGKIVLYDFGNVVEFSRGFKSKVNQLMISLYQKDVEEFVDLLIQLEILNVNDDIDVLELKAFFNYFFKYLETLDLDTLKLSVVQGDLQGKFQSNFRVNQDFISLFRVFSLLDGTYSILDPKFNYISAIGPFTDNMMNNPEFLDYRARKDFNKLRSYPRMLQNTDSNILRLQQKTKNINKDFQQLQLFMVSLFMVSNLENFGYILMLIIPYYIWKNNEES